ncbi:MAG: transposase [Caldilineaceae bacterium SB0664_bin_22]|nr:transposase [Caldilineaceae bacterium SB0664_bin_22]
MWTAPYPNRDPNWPDRRAGREATPSAAILNSQSVKTTEVAGPRGLRRRQEGHRPQASPCGRHLGAVPGRGRAHRRPPGPGRGAAGAGPAGGPLPAPADHLGRRRLPGPQAGHLAGATPDWVLDIVPRPTTAPGFQVLPRRWVVERTFAWLGRYRRLSKDYEGLPETSEAWIRLAMIDRMLHRLGPA